MSLLSLKNKKEFTALFKTGRKSVLADLVVYWRATKGGPSRLGVVVGKNFSKKAVQRNLIRRRIKAFFIEKKGFLTNFPRDILVVVKKEAGQKSFFELKKQLEKFLEKTKEK